jgi:hypothetical protein
MGVVIDTGFDEDTNEAIWAVRFDDGDIEDFNAKELAAVMYDDGAGVKHNTSAGQWQPQHHISGLDSSRIHLTAL